MSSLGAAAAEPVSGALTAIIRKPEAMATNVERERMCCRRTVERRGVNGTAILSSCLDR
jgi:hypothetical protein